MTRSLARVIPCLLLDRGGLYKTTRFEQPRYVGDPINAVRVFNDKEADELVLLDIGAGRHGRSIDFDLVGQIAGECFMPMCYGGGIRSLDDCDRVFGLGVEKVAVNTAALASPEFVTTAAARFGSQSVAVSIDVRRTRRGARVFIDGGRSDTGLDAVAHARRAEQLGAGEILLQSIDRDGTGEGYDLELVATVCAAVDVPVVAAGGAATTEDLGAALRAGAAGAAAGSMFVFHGRRRAVLISYPSSAERSRLG